MLSSLPAPEWSSVGDDTLMSISGKSTGSALIVLALDYLVLLGVDDEEDEHHQVLLVAPQVGSILPGGDAVEYNQVLGGGHIANVSGIYSVLLQILSLVAKN